MYIEPNSRIIFLQNCPLDSKYQNTIYFNSEQEQFEYFYSLKKHELAFQSYQRVTKGVCRVQLKAEDLFNCNYMMFQNTSFSNKWFYAFITNVDYISNIVSEVTFKIDDMETWHFDYTLLESFVEREHSVTDERGSNLISENVELGDYMTSYFTGTNLFDEWCIIIASPYIQDNVSGGGGMYGGMYSGVYFLKFEANSSGVDAIKEYITGLQGKEASIVAIYLVPKKFTGELENVVDSALYAYNIEKTIPNSLGDYIPKNNKLLTYPYTYCGVTTYSGEMSILKYENFSTDNMNFTITGDCTPSASFVCIPLRYNNQTGNCNEMVTLDKIPFCTWISDSYAAWLAQNKSLISNRIALSAVGGVVGSGVGLTTVNPRTFYGSLGQLVATVTSSLASMESAKAMPNHAHGTASGVVEYAYGLIDFHFTQVYIREDFAKAIDDYFTMFGYATKKVKIPNRTSRPHWNYVQTVGCNIIGSCPSDAITNIKSIYDNGITFWKNGANVGNYSLDNSPQ